MEALDRYTEKKKKKGCLSISRPFKITNNLWMGKGLASSGGLG
jgi:hypothetical protein